MGEEYEDAAKEVEDGGKSKVKQTKESIQRKQKKGKVEEISSESTSSDSITGKSIPVTIFDLTLNERMNGLAYWMKHIG